MTQLHTTPLHSRHVAAGALMSPFAGFDMPIQYTSIEEEHNAVRTACGVFDVSHMGEVNISGPAAEAFVNYLFSNDITGAPVGQVFYGMMLNGSGGVVDDLLVYKRAADSFLLVINASNIAKDVAWIESHAEGFDVQIDNLSDVLAEIALQGPDSEEVMSSVLGINVADLKFYTFREELLDGRHILVSRTGYTGEDGFEIYGPADAIASYWDALMDSGRVKPCGLGCRDTLRFEVGLPLYGNELADDITPVEACLSMFVKTDKPDFLGRRAILDQKAAGPTRKLVGLRMEGRAIPRHGYEVVDAEGNTIGVVTTGYRGISLPDSIAAALIATPHTAKDTRVMVRIRNKVWPAVVTSRKFYNKNYKK